MSAGMLAIFRVWCTCFLMVRSVQVSSHIHYSAVLQLLSRFHIVDAELQHYIF